MKIDLRKPWAGMVPIESVVRNPEQPRVSFPAGEIAALAASLRAEAQVTPCAVMPSGKAVKPDKDGLTQVGEWMLVDGEMRWRAARKAGLRELFICYRPGVTAENLHIVSFAANFCRTAHTKAETARAIDKERAAGRTYDAIGEIVGKTNAWACQHHQLLQLHPELLKFVDEPDPFTGRKLAMKNALLFVGQPHDRQLAVYRRHRCKPSGEQYHALRTTAVVKSERSPRDDFEYLTGLLAGATAKLQTAGKVGEVMLRRFEAERLSALDRQIDAACALLAGLKKRIGGQLEKP